jgi:RND family efflux transporter MFP subunit
MPKQTIKLTAWLIFLLVALVACKEKPEVIKTVRAIKAVTVSNQAAFKKFKIPGKVAAVDSSDLSFQVGGQVVSVEVDIGDRVKKGQLLASLDPETYQLELKSVKAELSKARDNVAKTKAEYERHKRIYEQGAGVKRFVEVSEYNYKAARSAVDLQVARLDLANRNLRKTKLLSPYDGTIALRSVQPHEEVQVGRKVFEINATGKMEIELSVPETAIGGIHVDDEAMITFPTLPGETIKGRISYIGSAALKASTFPVKIELIDSYKKVKPGMTAEAIFTIKNENQKPGYTIPIQAILPSLKPGQGYVFVYNPRTSVVNKISVNFTGMEQKNAIVSEGIKAGDIIAVAGVSFLADGLQVKLLKESGDK